MTYGLITSLHSLLGDDLINQHEYNYRLIDNGMGKLEKMFTYHQKEEIYAHRAHQIKYLNDSVATYLGYLNGRFSNMILGHNGDGINEVTDARVDNTGHRHKTLQDRLYQDYAKLNEVTQKIESDVNKHYKEYRETEYRFEPKEQEPEFITDLSPYTNAVMQSFWIDPKTKVIYMTQARPGNHYMLTRLKPNGQFIDRLFVKNGGHGTHNAYRYINGQLWIYSAMLDDKGNNKFARFKYKSGEITYGSGTEDVMPNVFNTHYTSAIYNPIENLMIFRREYKASKRQEKNALNFVEVRSADDIDKGIDKVLYQMDIPMEYTSETQPMQGITYDAGVLYWYTGDSIPANPNYLQAFDIKTKKLLFKRRMDIGGIDKDFVGNFQEAEGMSMYYDEETGRKALLLGVTTGPGNNRHHSIYSIGQRGVNQFLKNLTPQVSMTDSGGRVKPLPIQNPAYLSDVTEIGNYYLYSQDTLNALDFPLPKVFRDAGWFFDVLPGNYNGAVRQVLTRNSTGRNMLKFERVIDIFDKSKNGKWNFNPQSAGYWEHIPESITKLSDLKIVGLDFYISTEESKRFSDFPKGYKGVAGWILKVESNTPENTTQVLRRNNFPSAHQFFVRNFGSGGDGKWSIFEGKVVE
ncbi:phage baseplate protein [Staphylococcus aureus]|uniref:phage baseplate protein n=1 Tax=Staphylococcus aureus TaxID=1280 RepID=UPI003F157101